MKESKEEFVKTILKLQEERKKNSQRTYINPEISEYEARRAFIWKAKHLRKQLRTDSRFTK